MVGLTDQQSIRIRRLSGGQVKRASLANELVARPSLLFLDEVTSGLDEQTDREVMRLFRQIANGGKTVVCITHSLANVEATCHLVVILTKGGRLAFVGTPAEAKDYFGITHLGDVYERLAQEQPAYWHDRFQSSPFFQNYVAERLTGEAVPSHVSRTVQVQPTPAGSKTLRQARVLTRRYLAIWQGDRLALLALLAQSVLVSLLLGLLFGNLDAPPEKKEWIRLSAPVPTSTRERLNEVLGKREHVQMKLNLLNMMVISCFWFGCNTAAKELVKERVIFHRERDYNLRIMSYFLSKLLVLTMIGLLQATLLFGIIRVWCHPPGPAAAQWLTFAALAAAGTAVGLFISAFARTEEVATALIPIAVIPQIILAGLIAPLKGVLQYLARGFVTVYWGQHAVESLLPRADLDLLNMQTGNWTTAMTVISFHAVAAALATIVILGVTSGYRRQA